MARSKKSETSDVVEMTDTGEKPANVTVAVQGTVDVDLILKQLAETQALARQLSAALVAEREAGKAQKPGGASDEATIRIENVCGASIAFHVTDLRGTPVPVQLYGRGDFKLLTALQVAEAKERYPHFFERGYVQVVGEPVENPNVILDLDAFLAALSFETIDEKIEAITSISTLFDLYHHIENQRFTHLDDKGNLLIEKDDQGNILPAMKELKIDSRLRAVEQAVQRQIAVVTNGLRVEI